MIRDDVEKRKKVRFPIKSGMTKRGIGNDKSGYRGWQIGSRGDKGVRREKRADFLIVFRAGAQRPCKKKENYGTGMPSSSLAE